MKLTRRELTAAGLGVLAASAAPTALWADSTTAMEAIDAVLGDAERSDQGISIGAPEIAENGNTVPISFEVDAAPEEVESVTVVADGNPNPAVATFHFSALAGAASASTRIRLAKTQNIIVAAKMADGSARVATREIKVTIGGCGG